MKQSISLPLTQHLFVAPSRVRGLKRIGCNSYPSGPAVAPSRVRGLKHFTPIFCLKMDDVAPSRVRGLKHYALGLCPGVLSRTFTGAWIETVLFRGTLYNTMRRTFTGAWIETEKVIRHVVPSSVAPSRVRGLKPIIFKWEGGWSESHLHGCVD